MYLSRTKSHGLIEDILVIESALSYFFWHGFSRSRTQDPCYLRGAHIYIG